MKVKTKGTRPRGRPKQKQTNDSLPPVTVVVNSVNPARYFSVRTAHGGFISISVLNRQDVEIAATRTNSDERVVFRSNSAAPVRVIKALFRALHFALTTPAPVQHDGGRVRTLDLLTVLGAGGPTRTAALAKMVGGAREERTRNALSAMLNKARLAGLVRREKGKGRSGTWSLTPAGHRKVLADRPRAGT